MAENQKTLQFELVTPVRLMASQPVVMVVVPGGEGDFGVLPGHSPMLSTVRAGTICLYEEKSDTVSDRIFVEGGFAEVNPEQCTVLAEVAQPVKDITLEMADERLRKANDALMNAGNEGERRGAERELLAAEAMLAAVEAGKD